MNWTMPYPWRSRSDSVWRINMSSEPGNESFFCALRPILRILRIQDEITRVKLQVGYFELFKSILRSRLGRILFAVHFALAACAYVLHSSPDSVCAEVCSMGVPLSR